MQVTNWGKCIEMRPVFFKASQKNDGFDNI